MELNVRGSRHCSTAVGPYFPNSARMKAARLPRLDGFWDSHVQFLEGDGNINSQLSFPQRGASVE